MLERIIEVERSVSLPLSLEAYVDKVYIDLYFIYIYVDIVTYRIEEPIANRARKESPGKDSTSAADSDSIGGFVITRRILRKA